MNARAAIAFFAAGCSVGGGTDAGSRLDAFTPIDAFVLLDAHSEEMQPIPIEGGGVYEGALGVPRACDDPELCAPWGCLSGEICNDGLDNDCDGSVDEGCVCGSGAVEPCFNGPPARRGIGTCTDGLHTCRGGTEFGCWGPCEGGVGPRAETCDGADDACDGCANDAECCGTLPGSCPLGEDDPRVPIGRPFERYTLEGRAFVPDGAASWTWRVEGGACDRMLYATERRVSYTLAGATSADARETETENLVFIPTLPGDYNVTLHARGEDGSDFRCTFVVRVRAPGLRVELCWDRPDEVDLDLWLHKPDDDGDWLTAQSTCYWANCRNDRGVAWGYEATPGGLCREAEAAGGMCKNPRLDLDNNAATDAGTVEGITVDAPNDRETFRVAVNYFQGTGAVQPLVQVYCGGELRAAYGGADVAGRRYGASPVEGLDTAGEDTAGSFWRVVDVRYDAATDSCRVTPVVNESTGGACIETSADRSYDGPCARGRTEGIDAGMLPDAGGSEPMCE